MERARRRSLDRVGSLVIVLGGHLLVIAALSLGRPTELRKVNADSRESLIWIPVSPDVPRKQREPAERVDPRSRPQIALQGPHSKHDAGAAAVQPSEPIAGRTTDWALEAETVAGSMAPRMIKELQRTCAEAERRAQALPQGCKKRSDPKAWEPEPKRAGFVGIFPYVRLGPCVIGLGFFGCVGKGSPNGTLLEDIHNPDRPRSSVPDLPESAFSKSPVPQVFKESEQP